MKAEERQPEAHTGEHVHDSEVAKGTALVRGIWKRRREQKKTHDLSQAVNG
jgi:hypothetical protein